MYLMISFSKFRRIINARYNQISDKYRPLCSAIWQRTLARSLYQRLCRGEFTEQQFLDKWKIKKSS